MEFLADSDKTRSNGFKAREGTLRKKFFSWRVMKHSNSARLPRDVLYTPSLEAFKAKLDGALGNLV